MAWESAKNIADFLLSLPVSDDTVIFDFIGGEPLIEIDLISKISDYIVSEMIRINHPWLANYSFRFTTNGLLYSNCKVQKYIEKYKDRLSVQISIDGTRRKHDLNRVFPNGVGSYDKILPSVKLWQEQFESKAQTLMVISHGDLPFLSESVIHLIQLGLRNIYISLVVEDVWQEGDERIFEKELMIIADFVIENKLWDKITLSPFRQELGLLDNEEHIFPCGNLMYVFDSDENIYTCVRFADYSLRSKEQRIIGSVKKGIDYNKLRPLLAFDRESAYPKECLDCEVATCCRWCPAENYDSSNIGTVFNRTTTVCRLHKANVLVKNYFWNKINNVSSTKIIKRVSTDYRKLFRGLSLVS